MNLTNTDCMGQDDLCKVVFTPFGVESKAGDYKEPDYIKSNIFTPIVKIGEPKVWADKELEPNYSGEADNESQGEKIRRGLFCVAGKDSEFIDIDDLF